MKYFSLPYFYVFIQFACLAVILFSGPWIASGAVGLMVEVAGIALGVAAILQMKPGLKNILPLPQNGNTLITNGVYRIIRHPMYLAQVVAVIPLVVDVFNPLRLAALLVLILNLIFKLNYEEKRLLFHYEAYRAYMNRSWRLIPFLY